MTIRVSPRSITRRLQQKTFDHCPLRSLFVKISSSVVPNGPLQQWRHHRQRKVWSVKLEHPSNGLLEPGHVAEREPGRGDAITIGDRLEQLGVVADVLG